MSATAIATAPRLRRSTLARAGREQARLAGAQLIAGAGNLAFALVCAHVLAPRGYSRLAAFLAAYLLLYMPFSALSAGGALEPAGARRRRQGSLALGLAVAAGLAGLAATGLAGPLGMPAGLLLALAAAAPIAGPLALERGRALGEGRWGASAGSLLAEPVLRLGLGLPGALAFGAVGAAGAVVLGGYAALAVAARFGPRPPDAGVSARARASAPSRGTAGAVTAAFLLLAVLQTQDVLWANAQLSADQAARFAVLSTLGGISAFASATVPLVYLPRARSSERAPLAMALGAAGLLGAGAMLPALLDARWLLSAIFGARYGAVAPLAVPYLVAMALLGVSRVLVAHRCALPRPAPDRDRPAPDRRRPVLGLVAAAAGLQAVLLGLIGHSAAATAGCTLAASVALVAGLAGRPLLSALRTGAAVVNAEFSFPKPLAMAPARAPARRRLPLVVAALTLAGAVVRILAGRSLWLDEATSITQARMPFGAMLHSLGSGDVHPPLHDTILWLLYRVLGDSAAVMRSPSLVAGILLIPLLYALGRDLWDERTGLVAAALATFAPFLIWYSQEARMYALLMLFATAALWAQVRILRDEGEDGRWRWWALYSLATAALAWTQYFGSLFALVQQGAFLVAICRGRRELVLPWLISGVVILAVIAPLVPFVYHQYQVNQASGRGFGVAPSQNGSPLEAGHRHPTVYAVLTNVIWGIWGYHSAGTMRALTALWPLGILLALTLLGRGRSWKVALLGVLALVPLAILFAVGQLKPFLFEVRYFSAGVPVVLLLLARVCARWPGHRLLGSVALAAVLLGSFGVAFADQQFSQTNPRIYDFQGALARISREARPGDVIVYEPQFLHDLVAYYAPRLRSAPLGADPAALAPRGHVFVLASFQEDPQNAAVVRAGLAQLDRRRHEVRRFWRPQVWVWEFR